MAALCAKVIEQIDGVLATPDDEWSLALPATDRPELRGPILRLIRDAIRPAYERYRAVVADEIGPHARAGDRPGLMHIPGGSAAYAALARAHTSLDTPPEEVHAIRDDAIMATGRSDYPNQVNNILGFPFIFRGALDVRSTEINEEMKMAATRALALLAKQDVPDSVAALYGLRNTVERGFNRLKQWRGVATRYDKYALTYLGGVLLACAVIHARVGANELGDTP